MKSYSPKKDFICPFCFFAHFLKDISLPKITKEQSEQCEGEITKGQSALGNMVCKKN